MNITPFAGPAVAFCLGVALISAATATAASMTLSWPGAKGREAPPATAKPASARPLPPELLSL